MAGTKRAGAPLREKAPKKPKVAAPAVAAPPKSFVKLPKRVKKDRSEEGDVAVAVAEEEEEEEEEEGKEEELRFDDLDDWVFSEEEEEGEGEGEGKGKKKVKKVKAPKKEGKKDGQKGSDEFALQSLEIALDATQKTKLQQKIQSAKDLHIELAQEEEVKAKKGAKKEVKKEAEQEAKEEEGGDSSVVYLGRIPHGFYEPQMKTFFSQFGKIIHFRLARNKRTGKSKHFAFIEFEYPEVAKIVSETMNDYLIFGHIMQCGVIPKNKLHPNMFKGSKIIPFAFRKREIAKRHRPKEQEKIDQNLKNLKQKNEKNNAKLKALGINYSFNM